MIEPIIDSRVIEHLQRLLKGARHIVLTCHLSPDGDALGSTLGLCRVLRNMGKDAHVVVPDQVPRALLFVPGVRDVVVYSLSQLRGRFLFREADLVFCLDFNTLQRVDKLAPVIAQCRAPRVLIDHHLDPDNDFDVKISFPHLSSTCEVVYRTLMQLALLRYVDTEAAQCFYTGMMTDTGNFTYSSDYPEIYEIVAQLVAYGINKQWLYNMAMNTFSAESLRLQGYALSEKMQIFPDAGAALITLTRAELERFGYRKGDTEGLVNKPLSIPEVHWVMFLREDPDQIKVSCRSEGNFSVSDICARYFGGGGHRNAAGGDFQGSMEDAIDVFFQVLEDTCFENE
ncbi:MAG: bifunctional oligoribonuclease/PAP phosphatase NrnA [Bacteroidales bacterium]|nr:bifunctional oligoribonuclease/PAP phosphatase NrnA [Bacteroidales bacterium]